MKRWLLIAIAAFATAGFVALGIWQVERRAWKLALIERVDQRIHAAPVAAPGPSEWPRITPELAEYRRVTATGRLLEGRQTLVRAVTELGAGFWLMAPLRTDQGFIVLVNRGFVPADWPRNAVQPSVGAPVAGANETDREHQGTDEQPAASAETAVSVTGLLRMSEPHGAFLRSNVPAENRWYSRDVEAIAQAQQLTDVAPYFIDAEAPERGGPEAQRRPPVAGLTVVQFRNSHLQYAITWFALAAMALVLGVRIARTR